MLTPADLELARELARGLYGESVRVEPFARSNNPIVRIEAPGGVRILKLARADAEARIAKEVVLIDRVARAGIPVPRIEHADPTGQECGRAYLVMHDAGAQTVLDVAGRSDAHSMQLFSDMGRIHSAIHEISFEASGDIGAEGIIEADQGALVEALRSWAGQLVDEGLLSRADVDRFRTATIPDPTGTSLCHGDFHAVQCVVQDDRITAVVDWEAAWSGNPGIDLAFTHAYLDFYASKPLRKSYLEGYTEHRDLPADYVAAYLPVRMAQVLGVLRAWHGQGDRVWRSALQGGRVERLVALFQTYCRLHERSA